MAEDTKHTNNIQELCLDDTVNKLIMTDITAVGKKQGLKGFEFPRKIYISSVPFSVENDLLTPTFKLRRPQARQRTCNTWINCMRVWNKIADNILQVFYIKDISFECF